MTAPTVSLVTGSQGSAHVTSANAGNLNAGMLGTGSYIMPGIGSAIAASIGSGNTVSIGTGTAVHNGRQIDIETSGTVSYISGAVGKYRHDLIVLRYVKSGSTESASIVVIQGSEASSAAAAADPAYNAGSILDGAATSDMPLFRLVFAETAVSLVRIASAVHPLVDLIYPVGSYYWSSASTSPATLFGGTWTQVKDRFVLAAGDTYDAGDTGGEATHTLTVSEIPSHTHSIRVNGGSAAGYISTNSGGAGVWSDDYSGNAGGGEAHNNMPPYIVACCWRRTA